VTSPLKKQIIDEIIAREGGYVNDPSDSGGETNYGITVVVARNNGYLGKMKDMPRAVAFNIYATEYWDKLNLDQIEQHSALICEELADTAVNMGTGRAAEFFQRSLNALNDCGRLYADLKVDKSIGPATINAFKSYLAHRGTKGIVILLRAMNSLQGAFYINLAERREKDEKFLAGWLLNRVK
jgi:lysozyme family protein